MPPRGRHAERRNLPSHLAHAPQRSSATCRRKSGLEWSGAPLNCEEYNVNDDNTHHRTCVDPHWCLTDVALQFGVGLLPERRSGPDPPHRHHLSADRTPLKTSARVPRRLLPRCARQLTGKCSTAPCRDRRHRCRGLYCPGRHPENLNIVQHDVAAIPERLAGLSHGKTHRIRGSLEKIRGISLLVRGAHVCVLGWYEWAAAMRWWRALEERHHQGGSSPAISTS
jgi:hypothetical protein